MTRKPLISRQSRETQQCAAVRTPEFVVVTVLMALSLMVQPARGEELAAYACGHSPGECALMTIVLPPGWKYEAGEQASTRVQKFVFISPQGAFPYLWTMIEQCNTERLEKLEEQAAAQPHRNLLSGGVTGESYYDSGRRILWIRTKDDVGNASVSATIFHKHQAQLKFFDQRSHMTEFEPVIVAVIDNLRLHDSAENVAASDQPVPVPDHVDAGAFETTSASRFPYLLCFSTIFVISSLAAIEFQIRRRRHLALVAEIDKAQAERKSRRLAKVSCENEAAEAYVQSTRKRVRTRRE